MLMRFTYDLLLNCFRYLPLITGAYITILILRYPDLTIEASWSLGAIITCIISRSYSNLVPPLFAPFIGFFVGSLCGLLTSGIFIISGRVKLLAGLISYYILEAIGFHLLGKSASIYLPHSLTGFGYPNLIKTTFCIYGTYSVATLLVIIYWQRSSWGIKSRLLGEKPLGSNFFRISINKYFTLGLICSNAIVGFGGGLYGMYYGQASNIQGIGLVLKALLALLIGDEILKILKLSKRSVPLVAFVGAFIFVFLTQASEFIQINLASRTFDPWFKPTDKQIVVAIVLISLLWARKKGRDVSTW